MKTTIDVLIRKNYDTDRLEILDAQTLEPLPGHANYSHITEISSKLGDNIHLKAAGYNAKLRQSARPAQLEISSSQALVAKGQEHGQISI